MIDEDEDFLDDTHDEEAEIEDSDVDDDDDEGQDDDGETPLAHHMALLTKNGMIALLLLQIFSDGGVIVRLDPREGQPAANRYTDPNAAESFFTRSLRTSERNGWVVAWEGAPGFG